MSAKHPGRVSPAPTQPLLQHPRAPLCSTHGSGPCTSTPLPRYRRDPIMPPPLPTAGASAHLSAPCILRTIMLTPLSLLLAKPPKLSPSPDPRANGIDNLSNHHHQLSAKLWLFSWEVTDLDESGGCKQKCMKLSWSHGFCRLSLGKGLKGAGGKLSSRPRLPGTGRSTHFLPFHLRGSNQIT